MIKDLFGILVTVGVNVLRHVIPVNIQIIQIVSVKKKLIDLLIEKCTENDDDVDDDDDDDDDDDEKNSQQNYN